MERTNVLVKEDRATEQRLTDANSDAQLIMMWLSDKALTTQKSYASTIKQFLSLVGKGLIELKIEQIYQWRDHCLERYSLATARKKLATVRSLIRYAADLRYIPFNMALPVKIAKAKDTVSERILAKDQVAAVIEAAAEGRDRILLTLMYKLGLRVSEAIALTWKDFRPHPVSQGDYIAHIFGKGNKDRYVKIPAWLYAQLASLRVEGCDHVFLSRNKRPLDRTMAHRIIKAAGEKAGIEGVSCHWLRHSHATHSLANGAPIHLVSESLGHSSIAITGKYLHVNPDQGSSDFI